MKLGQLGANLHNTKKTNQAKISKHKGSSVSYEGRISLLICLFVCLRVLISDRAFSYSL